MRAIQATVTERGQVTIPAAVRRHLGVERGMKILFQIDEDGAVRVMPTPFTYETVRASVPPLDPAPTKEQLALAVDEARTRRYRRTLAAE
jgi:AbrB family looped-hinge helix DNA binding protein